MRNTFLLLFISLLSVRLIAAEPQPLPGNAAQLGEFVDWLDSQMLENAIPGGAVAIVNKESVLHMQTWGLKSLDYDQQVTSESIFRLASMSKTFAGTAAGILVHTHLQTWDAPLTELFPALQLGNGRTSQAINLRHVVSHSTGLMPHSYSNMLDAGVPYDQIKSKFGEIPTICAPGECYGYQNVVFSLVADVIEERTGDSYEKFLQEQLFKPLGMNNSSVGEAGFNASIDATSPHRRVRGDWRTTTNNTAYYTVAPASGVNASVFDMTKWLRANLGAFPDVLASDVLAEFQRPVIPTSRGDYFNHWTGVEKAYYAIGWRVIDYKGIRVIHHGGGVRGYRSEMVFVPELDIGMVLLLNAESRMANDVVPAFLDNLLNSH